MVRMIGCDGSAKALKKTSRTIDEDLSNFQKIIKTNQITNIKIDKMTHHLIS